MNSRLVVDRVRVADRLFYGRTVRRLDHVGLQLAHVDAGEECQCGGIGLRGGVHGRMVRAGGAARYPAEGGCGALWGDGRRAGVAGAGAMRWARGVACGAMVGKVGGYFDTPLQVLCGDKIDPGYCARVFEPDAALQ